MSRVLKIQQLLAASCVAALLGSTTVRGSLTNDLVVPDLDNIAHVPAAVPENPEQMPDKAPETPAAAAPEPSSDTEAPTATPQQDPPIDFAGLEDASYFATEGVDYVAGKVPSADIANIGSGVEVDSAVDCAEACTKDDACNAAAFYIANFPEGSKNCYLKTVTPGCTVQGDVVKNPDVWLLMNKDRCGDNSGAPGAAPEPVAETPGAVMPMYESYTGVDYPQPKAGVSRLVKVEDMPGAGTIVDTIADCEKECTERAALGCNALSFYTDPSLYGGKNCWIKKIADPCELPDDALTVEVSTLLLDESTCTNNSTNSTALLPGEAEGPTSEAPTGATAPAPRGTGESGIAAPSNSLGLYAGAWWISVVFATATLF